ncbi:unnamed protein product, partial [Adineta steineri]
ESRLKTTLNDERTNIHLKSEKISLASSTESAASTIILPSDDNVPPKPALPSKTGFIGSRLQINNKTTTNANVSSQYSQYRTGATQKVASSTSIPLFNAKESCDKNVKLSKPKDEQLTSSSSLLTDLFHSQTKQII